MQLTPPESPSSKYAGFSLVEMAIVLAIVGALIGGLLPLLSGQIEQQRTSNTRKQLEEIKDALLGYAITNGRLPCPTTLTNNGVEKFASGGSAADGNCSNFYDGFVPAVTLGLPSINSQGLAVDSWNNPIRYAVTQAPSKAFTTNNGMTLSSNAALTVCSTASTSTTSCSVANTTLTTNSPAILYSLGPSGNRSLAGDEAQNAAGTQVFVSHDPSPTFDDIVTWLSPNTLFNRMVAAGKLP